MQAVIPNTKLQWIPDILPGFEQTTVKEIAAADGPADIVLIRRRCDSPGNAAVLYVHGFIDYFFQTHLADFYHDQGLHFSAVDLRRHGRSLKPHQLPNYTANFDEYLQDLDIAIDILRKQEKIDWLLLNGHSTGGLLAAIYGHRGQHRQHVDAIFLNSPFLDMNIPSWQAAVVEPVLAALGKWFPHLRYPGLSPVYAQSIHHEHHGQWHFKSEWKPVAGFPVRAGWFRAIHNAQAEIARGLNLNCPCLVLHAEKSCRTSTWTDKAMTHDIVLNVADIKRLSLQLGPQVTLHPIPEGMHDLSLSNLQAREQVWQWIGNWLSEVRILSESDLRA